ncbi:G-protein coupled receptor 15 isoform X1 [Python bivittatus]|uniref:G-protein coupled receptor 15 isoform X1 n=1 Tax=Python bivittatus TaxID=176946 RepID=A0A9F2R4V2_PYTBI|nr:G-protein coupled receptor 15 isoform X1 [Python bivittatus]
MEETTPSYDYFYSLSPDAPEENCQVLKLPYMETFVSVLYIAIFLVGTASNGLLIGVLIFKQRVWRLTDTFIVNLAISDFSFLITLPFWVDKELASGLWRSGSVLCKGSSYIISVNMYCSIFLLTWMSGDRYLTIMYPSVARKIRTKLYPIFVCISVWILSCLLGLPTLQSRELRRYNNNTYCVDKETISSNWIGSLLLLILAFFIPLFSILILNYFIIKKLYVHYQKFGKHDKKLRKSIKIVFTITVVFLFSWIPFNIFKILALISSTQELKQPFCLHYKIAYLGMELGGLLAFTNSCTNPFIYYFFDDCIRRATMQSIIPCRKTNRPGSSFASLDTCLRFSES